MKHPSADRNIGRVAKVAIALVSAAVALGVSELVVRGLDWAPQVKSIDLNESKSVYKRSTNSVMGFELKANYRDDQADLSMSYPRTNAHGQRDIERSIEKNPGVRRIILLGDSVVEGHGIRNIDDTISRQIEMLYEDGSTEVLNFGVSGYCTLAEVELLRVKGLNFRPDIVLLVFVGNDFDNFNREAFELGTPFDRPNVIKQLFVNSHLFRMSCLRLNLFHYGAEHDPMTWNKQAIGDNNVVVGLKQLRQLARDHDFDVVILVWPHFLDDRIIYNEMIGDELVIERLGRMNGFACVRLSKYFEIDRSSHESPVNPRLRYTLGDKFHPSREGCRIAARAIQEILDDIAQLLAMNSRSYEDPEVVAIAARHGNSEPDRGSVEVNRGTALEAEGKTEQAMKHYLEAIRLNPRSAIAYHNIGLIFVKQGKLDDAIHHLSRALQIKPDYPDAHMNLGVAFGLQKKFEEAIRHFRQALKIKPKYAGANNNLGYTLFTQGHTDEAIEHYQRALEIEPDHADALDNLGKAMVTQGKIEQGLGLIQRALKVNPDHPSALFNLAKILQTRGQTDQAIQNYRHALKVKPGNAAALNNIGIALESKGQYDEAIAQYNAALRLMPGQAVFRRNLARAQRLREKSNHPAP